MRCPDPAPPRTGTQAAVLDRPAVHRYAGEVFGCALELATAGTPAVPFPSVAQDLDQLGARFSRFRGDSEISRLNARAGTWVEISPDMHRMLAHALRVAVESHGLVNAAVLPRLIAAGYATSWPLPQHRAPAALQASDPVQPLTQVLELQRTRARLQPGCAVDVGGLAKGMWADDVVRLLGGDAVCSLGGDVSCAGPGPTGEGWPVGLPDGRVTVVRDGGVATSGTGKRRWGRGAHHIIDPRTGLPSASDVSTCSVLARTATAAEWMATAVVVGGGAEADRLAGSARFLTCFTWKDEP